jgi:hypothetical protein
MISKVSTSTKFERARRKLTYRDKRAPHERHFEIVLETLNGNDPQMKADMAYTTIMVN